MRYLLLSVKLIIAVFLVLLAGLPACTTDKPAIAAKRANASPAASPRVWFTPGNDTPDLLEMFRAPESWQKARSMIQVFRLGPQHFHPEGSLHHNTLEDLKRVNAFAKLRSWGIDLGIAAGAIKPWDCTGTKAARITLNEINNALSADGRIRYIAMDEPLHGGVTRCGLTLEETARRTAAYIAAVANASPVKDLHFGDTEPYPQHHRVAELIQWVRLLKRNGVELEFFHVDISMRYVDMHPEVNMVKDLRALQASLRDEGISLGVILWSGYNPVSSDRKYYDYTMEFARKIKNAIGAPEQIIFASWVLRAPRSCDLPGLVCAKASCTREDPAHCLQKSIPFNLPESGGTFSHTQLINDAMTVLTR